MTSLSQVNSGLVSLTLTNLALSGSSQVKCLIPISQRAAKAVRAKTLRASSGAPLITHDTLNLIAVLIPFPQPLD